MTAFLSTYVNKIDKKGRVSVPAAFRATLAGQSFQGIIAFPSVAVPAVEAFGRDMLEAMNRRRLDQSLEGGAFERVLMGDAESTLVETVMALATELPFDPEGRIALSESLCASAGINDRVAFVGRGNRFQMWAPETFSTHQARELAALRARLGAGGDLP